MNTTGNLLTLDKTSHHFSEIMTLDQLEFPRPWSERDWSELNWDHHQLFGRVIGTEIVGFSLFSFIPGDDSAHLLKICLLSELRGKGEAAPFWEACILKLKSSGIKSIYLEVEAHNQRAIGFYQKQGFTLLRKIKGYYSDGADALTMQLTL